MESPLETGQVSSRYRRLVCLSLRSFHRYRGNELQGLKRRTLRLSRRKSAGWPEPPKYPTCLRPQVGFPIVRFVDVCSSLLCPPVVSNEVICQWKRNSFTA